MGQWRGVHTFKEFTGGIYNEIVKNSIGCSRIDEQEGSWSSTRTADVTLRVSVGVWVGRGDRRRRKGGGRGGRRGGWLKEHKGSDWETDCRIEGSGLSEES